MSEATSVAPKTRRRPSYLGLKRNKTKELKELTELNAYLKTIFQTYKVEVHINGFQYPSAVCTIDMGAPLVPVELTQKQMEDISQRLKRVVTELGNDNSRVSYDSINNVFYASI